VDYELDDEARDQVRAAIYYAFSRRGIEIPFPIQVQYDLDPPRPDEATGETQREALLKQVDLFGSLTDEQRRAIAAATRMRTYGEGEVIVREGEPGQSMYVVASGKVAVVLEPEKRTVATIERGGYFGEMSLLTGEVRSATVVAQGDSVVLEVDAELFRKLALESPHAIERIGVEAITRKSELAQARNAARGVALADAPASLLSRMKRFLRLTQS
jgi:CRP-like cAMP-binding protein